MRLRPRRVISRSQSPFGPSGYEAQSRERGSFEE